MIGDRFCLGCGEPYPCKSDCPAGIATLTSEALVSINDQIVTLKYRRQNLLSQRSDVTGELLMVNSELRTLKALASQSETEVVKMSNFPLHCNCADGLRISRRSNAPFALLTARNPDTYHATTASNSSFVLGAGRN